MADEASRKALAACLSALEPLSAESRERVLAAVQAFYRPTTIGALAADVLAANLAPPTPSTGKPPKPTGNTR